MWYPKVLPTHYLGGTNKAHHLIHSLRTWEYYINCGNNWILERTYRVISGYWQRKAGVIIPPNVVDMELSIPHIGPIIINNYCDIG